MEMRAFGRAGMQLSVLGFGCGAVGGLMVRGDPLDQERTIARAIARGPTSQAARISKSNAQDRVILFCATTGIDHLGGRRPRACHAVRGGPWIYRAQQ